MSKSADLASLLALCHDDPALFWKLILRGSPRRWQRGVCEEARLRLARGERHLRILIRSCHGAGKTTLAAVLALWFVSTRPYARGLTTAPTWAGVEGVFWVELTRLYNGSLLASAGRGRLLQTELSFEAGWDLVGLSTDHPVNLEGRHGAAGCRIVDEAKAVEPGVFESTEALLDAVETLDVMISTPSIPSGRFYEVDMKGGPGIIRSVVTIDDLIAEGLEGKKEWRDARALEWGLNSPEFESRCMARYISDAENALFPFSWIERAMEAGVSIDMAPVAGLDVAGSVSGDQSALALLAGPSEDGLYEVKLVSSWHERDTATTRGKALMLARAAGCVTIAVDYVGIGAGVGDAMREEKGIGIVPFRASDRAPEPDRFQNLKASIAWTLRLLLESGHVRLPKHDGLKRDLLAMKYAITPAGRIKVVDPPDSPDCLDSVLIALSIAAGGRSFTLDDVSGDGDLRAFSSLAALDATAAWGAPPTRPRGDFWD
jgi:phage terminase large subunit